MGCLECRVLFLVSGSDASLLALNFCVGGRLYRGMQTRGWLLMFANKLLKVSSKAVIDNRAVA